MKWVCFLCLFFSVEVWAYPEFIGYGYAACISCHYNGNGGGLLTDYGRALWSVEIAAKPFYAANADDETLGKQSGFLGSVPLPVFVRPHIKYRGMWIRENAYQSGDRTQFLPMQEDFGLTLQDGELAKWVVSATWGRVIQPSQYSLGTQGFKHVLAEEYFLRYQLSEGQFLYAGLMEKVFGLRNVDHESFQRKYEGFQIYNNNPDGVATSQGIIWQKTTPHSEYDLNLFAGNPYDDKPYKESGASGMIETDVGENERLGASVASAKNPQAKHSMLAVHFREQISMGSALMAEYGFIQEQKVMSMAEMGSYQIIRALILLRRGYNYTFTAERYNPNFNQSAVEYWKFETGFLIFPMPRLELRAEVVNEVGLSAAQAAPDSWSVLGQVHVSL